MLNPITYSEKLVADFLRYQLTTYPFTDERLYKQMRNLLSLEQTRATPLMRGPYVSLSRSFLQGASIADLVRKGILHPHLAALAPHSNVYGHQDQAIRSILSGKTTLVSTGTGSGKTECFLYPIISHCLTLRDENAPPGVTAVLVYPMNALAEDQLGRLRQLLCGTGISFGMYVGKTKTKASDVKGTRLSAGASRADYDARVRLLQAEKRHEAVLPPEERASREEMRSPGKQPRILLTNVKQLELLLTRHQDLELFDGARLDFLVFDEAHTFSGAMGGETACLIRRLQAYCGKAPGQTVCVATSATIADPERGPEAGREFASRFFGVESNDVTLVGETYEEDLWADKRAPTGPFAGNPAVQLQTVLDAVAAVEVDPTPPEAIQLLKTTFQAMTGTALDAKRWQESLYERLAANEVVYLIADALKNPRKLDELVNDLGKRLGRAVPEEEIVAWLALGAASRKGGRPLLRPVVHAFVRGVGGAVVSFPEGDDGPRLWLSREDVAAANQQQTSLDVTSCTTCGQHYFVHFVVDFEFLGKSPGGGEAIQDRIVWRSQEEKAGGKRVVLLDRVASDGDDDEIDDEDEMPRNTAQVFLCRICGALHPKTLNRCDGCGRPGPLVPLLAVGQHEDEPGKLRSCVACASPGGNRLGQYREPARPVRAQTVADVHVLAQSMIHYAERRRLIIFADNRQDAAFQAGWMADHGRRFRLRSMMFEEMSKRPISVGDLGGALDDLLEADDDLSRALVPEVWREDPKESTGTRHATMRRRYLRMQVLRELVTGLKQRRGLEPWGRLLVEYHGLSGQLPFFQSWGKRIDIDPTTLFQGVATLLDQVRRHGALHDGLTKMYSHYWHESDREISNGWFPLTRGGPKGIGLRRTADDKPGRVMQWLGIRGGTAARQAALRWGVVTDDVDRFFDELWALLTSGELGILVAVKLTGRRGEALPGSRGAYQIDVDKLFLHTHYGHYRCTTCRRRNMRPTPKMACPAWRCKGTLAQAEENKDDYDLMVLDERFAMIRPREHSAQVPEDQREMLERAFKGQSELVNTLVSTPTLELGVDIGTLDAVLMRNVPPLPANYKQRAGRAGRRHRMAVNLTYASLARHDRAYFAAPLKMLDGSIDPPRFNLKNQPMVRKHVHAVVITMLYRLVRAKTLPAPEHAELETTLAHCFPTQIKVYLFDDAEHVRHVPFDVGPLDALIAKHEIYLLDEIERVFAYGWPLGDRAVVEPPVLRQYLAEVADGLAVVIRRLESRLLWALEQMARLDEVRMKKGTLDPEEDALRARCDRMIKRLKGKDQRARRDAEGFDDTYTYAVLAAEGFLPGYGLDGGTVVGYYNVSRYLQGTRDWELRRAQGLALREYVPGNLIYANGHRFLPRFFHLQPQLQPTLFQVDLTNGAIAEVGLGSDVSGLGLGSATLAAVPICDVDLPHQSYITDDETFRFQLPVTILGYEQKRHGGGKSFVWGNRHITSRASVHLRLVNIGASSVVRTSRLGYPLCLVCGMSRSPLASERDRETFAEEHLLRCKQPVNGAGFFADIVADALGLHGCADMQEAYSVAEALRRGAAQVLEVALGDLQLLAFGRPGETGCDILLYDPMPGGSGLLEQVVNRWDEIVATSLEFVETCPSQCASACIDCLLEYRNAFYHAHLDRHVAMKCLQARGWLLLHSHDVPPIHPAAPSSTRPTNRPEAILLYMLERAGFANIKPQHPIDLGKPLGTTTPDFFFEDPSGRYDGICIYLDGMSEANHGNEATRRRDDAIRSELRNRGYEVFEIKYGDLTDPQSMRNHFYRLGRILLGKPKAEALRDDPSWFDAALRDHQSEHPPAAAGGGWEEVLALLDEPWQTLAQGLARAGVSPPDEVDWDIMRHGRVTGQRAVMAWIQRSPFVALVHEATEPALGGQFLHVTPTSNPVEVAGALMAALGGAS